MCTIAPRCKPFGAEAVSLTQATRADFSTLKWCHWLNDEIINLYMQLLQVDISMPGDNLWYCINGSDKAYCLQETNMRKQAEGRNVPRAHIFNTFFWTRLACFGCEYDYAGAAFSSGCLGAQDALIHDLSFFFRAADAMLGAGVARWTKKVDVFSQDLLIIPINHHNLHWCLATVDMRTHIISYYDSMLGCGLSG